MSENTPIYQDLLSKYKKLQTENKVLRLRPSFNSTQVNVLKFLDIKNQMAKEALPVKTLAEVFEIATKYFIKINNIHSVSFFYSNTSEKKIDLLEEAHLPKKFISFLNREKKDSLLYDFLFPQENNVIFTDEEKNPASTISKSYFGSYETIVNIPLFGSFEENYSFMILSKKKFKSDDFYRIIVQSLQAQLQSIIYRIHLSKKLIERSKVIDTEIEQKTHDIEKMNKELLRQIKIHKQEEQKVSEQLNLYKSVIHQQKDMVLRINTDGQILFKNPAFNENKTISNKGKDYFYSYLGEGDFPGLTPILEDFAKGAQWVLCEIQLLSDSYQWYNFYFTPIKNKRGLITSIQIVARNIDQIKTLEQKLRDQRKMLFNMINTNGKVNFILDGKGNIDLTSNNWEEITSQAISASINKSFLQIVHKDDYKNISKTMNDLLQNNKKKSFSEFHLSSFPEKKATYNLEMNAINDEFDQTSYLFGSFFLK
ncbi:MAG: hypothetical protein B7C24_14535 [Bacteroidetes bacterium 4572_77]|nr:MAG: hypothetical protein B7C24_14535 [Bacteroidetes bacterium 4572_77]